MRILMSVMPLAGHVRPIAHLAAALIGRGHRVTVYTGARRRDRIQRLVARMVPWQDARDFDETRVRDTFPDAGRAGFRGMLGNFRARVPADLPPEFHHVDRLGDPARKVEPAERTSPPHILVTQAPPAPTRPTCWCRRCAA